MQAGGRRFEPCHVHQLFLWLQSSSQIHLCPNLSVLVPAVHGLCTNGLLDRDCAYWSRRHSVSGYRCDFIGSTVELFQSFALHLQLHLEILLEDLRIAWSKQLGDPLIGYASGTQTCGIRGAKQEPDVGIKRRWKRGPRSNHGCTRGCLWVP